MSGQLERLLAQATPGPWTFNNGTDPRGHKGEFRAPSPHNGFMLVGPWTNDHDARLIALAPDLAREYLAAITELRRHPCLPVTGTDGTSYCPHCEVLARYDELEQRAGQ